ncbi:MAG: hypothetical protein LBE12_17645 [Planctomycetaceae bacterium]|nr:hypothetical protein [Planctomycetaceae bacterium]
MSQADYYPNGNNSACDTIHSPLPTLNYSPPLAGLAGLRVKNNNSTDRLRNIEFYCC